MNNVLSTIVITIAASVLTLTANANTNNHNPDFLRQLKNPATYTFNKNVTESICATNNLQHVTEYDGSRGLPADFVNKYEQAVGALASGVVPKTSKYCTGTLISEDLFITAGHCIDSAILNEFVVFNYQKLHGSADLAVDEHFKIIEVMEKSVKNLDFAIIRLDGKPGLKYGFTKIKTSTVANGSLLTIIQHPSGKPKMVDMGHRNGTRSTVYMTYGDLDTEPGSSGSGIIDENGFLVGVHTNGGCSSSGGENAGVQMTEIVKASKVVKTLAKRKKKNI